MYFNQLDFLFPSDIYLKISFWAFWLRMELSYTSILKKFVECVILESLRVPSGTINQPRHFIVNIHVKVNSSRICILI